MERETGREKGPPVHLLAPLKAENPALAHLQEVQLCQRLPTSHFLMIQSWCLQISFYFNDDFNADVETFFVHTEVYEREVDILKKEF